MLIAQSAKLRAGDAALAAARMPSTGDFLPVVSVVDVASGDTIKIGDPPLRETQVVLLFSHGCEFCQASMAAWTELSRMAQSADHVAVKGVSRDPPEVVKAFLNDSGLAIDAGAVIETRDVFALRADVVPQVLVVRSGGRVVADHLGVLRVGTPDWARIVEKAELTDFGQSESDGNTP